MAEGRSTRDRRLFGATVLLGVVGSGLAALAGSKPWARQTGGVTLIDQSGGHVPLAGALGLVALACWGVLLVTRSWVRRAVTWLGLVVAVGLLVTTVVGRSSAVHSARSLALDLHGRSTGAAVTGWWWVSLVGALLALAAAVAAVCWVSAWPEMGSRYDAPGANPGAPAPVSPEEQDPVDLWRAIDEGRDPTDPGAH
jgi:uncharacterized membrane protein (TIGR02234 family)